LDKVRTEDTAIYFSGWSGFYPPMTLVMRNLVFPDSFAKFAVVNLVKNHQPNNHQALLSSFCEVDHIKQKAILRDLLLLR
jgi:hypothetical protein